VGLELFNPTGGASLGARPGATLNILDDDKGPGNLGFSAATFFVSEASSNALITVSRILGMTGVVSVDCATVGGGSAVPGVDFISTTNTLIFADGETNKVFRVPIISSPAVENNKTINLELSNPTGGAITNGQIIAALLTIVEDQPQAGSLDTSFTGVG